MNIEVNGQCHALPVTGDMTLLNLLRNDLQLNSPKYGCGLGECGACTVLVDGVAARACVIPARGMAGRQVTTMEGLRQSTSLHPVQQAFLETQAAQCGYCLSGMVMMAVSMLQHNPAPTDGQIRQQLSHNLCRCGAHVEIMQAVKQAAVLMGQAGTSATGPGGPGNAGVLGSGALIASDRGVGYACAGASPS